MKRAVIVVSFANLFFLDAWDTLASRWSDAALASPPHPTLAQFFGPLVIALLALTMLFWIVIGIAPRISRWLGLFAMLAPLNLFRMSALHLERQDLVRMLGVSGAIAVLALASILAIAAVARWHVQLLKLPALVALLLAPLLPIQLAYNLWRFEHLPPPSAYLSQPSATLLPAKANAHRVIWLLFDELDQSLVFDRRPASVRLPEFDRLRRESVYADHAEAPGIYTMEAIPGMLTGKYVERARATGPGDLLLRFGNGDARNRAGAEPGPEEAVPRQNFQQTRKDARWSSVRNIFDDLRDAGFNSAVLGAELPYCRAIGHSLASCDWFPSGTVDIALTRPSILDRAWYLLRTRPFAFPGLSSSRYFRAPLFDEETRRRSRAAEAATFDLMRRRAVELAADNRFQLVYMHFPIPHLLGLYDRRKGEYSTNDSSSYLDNLALADRTLGEIRAALPGDTTLLVTSDHPLRDWIIEDAAWWNDHETASLGSVPRRYVCLLVRIPGQPPRESHERVDVHNLIRQLFAGTPHI